MHVNLRSWLGLAFLLAVAGITLYWSQMETADLVTRAEPPALPESYYMIDAVILATDETGAVRYRLSAARAEEQPRHERLLLADVQLEYRAAAEIPWRMSASTAVAPTDRSYLELSGDVRLVGERPDGLAPVLVETNRLRVDAATWVARSKDEVSMVVGGMRLNAVGLRADLMTGDLELESDGHGQYLRQ